MTLGLVGQAHILRRIHRTPLISHVILLLMYVQLQI